MALSNTGKAYPGKPMTIEQRLKATLGAYDAQRRAEDNVALQAETGSTWSRTIAQRKLRKTQTAYKDSLKGTTAADPVAKRDTLASTMPVDSGTTATTDPAATTTDAIPAAPVAVTDPASQISPEEEAARLRAKLLLMGGTQRVSSSFRAGSNVGLRSLAAF